MKKLVSYLITAMMVFTMIPYTAFAETIETTCKDITICEPEEITLDLFVRSDVTVESDDMSVANGAVTGTALIISNGVAIYRSTIKIMPSKIGTTNMTVKADGEIKEIYRINVIPAEKTIDVHIGEKSQIEYISYFDEELTNTNTENITAKTVSKTQRVSTESVNGIDITEIQYVYKIQLEYQQTGQIKFSLIGSQSGEFCKITASVSDHEWEAEPSVDVEPTCIAEGSKSVHCTGCDAVKDITSIPVADHEYKWIIDTPATEENTGIKHEECIVCGKVSGEDTVIDKLTHTHDIIHVKAVEATCTESGNIEHYRCDKCGELYSDGEGQLPFKMQDVIIESTGHTEVIDAAVSVTCTSDGLTEGRHCINCGQVFEAQKIILAQDHRFKWVIDKEATNEEAGSKHKECIVCGKKINENTVIEPLHHVHEMVRTIAREATCDSDGNIEYYYCVGCSNCYLDASGSEYLEEEQTIIKAPGHVYNKWEMMNPSTCTRKGYEFTSCMKCGVAEIRELPLKQHRLEYETIQPTCTEDGAKIVYCKSCKYKISDTIPSTGHSDQKIPAIEPTCTDNGATEGVVCSNCKEILLEQKVIPAPGHDYSGWTLDKEATCSAAGVKSRVCNNCGERETSVIEKTDHTPAVIPAVRPTCTEKGLTEGIVCIECRETILAQGEVGAAGHKWEKTYRVNKTATASRAGSISYGCENCEAVNKKTVSRIKKITVATLVYNGEYRIPKVTVEDYNGQKLEKGIDFSVTYKNAAGTKTVKPKNVGTYKAVVTFKGKYSGSVIRTLKISPKSTYITGLTKGTGKFTVKWSKRTAQVTGYQICYSTYSSMKNSEYIRTTSNQTVSRTVKGLKSGKKYWVKVRTYKTVNGTRYYSAWSKSKYITTK